METFHLKNLAENFLKEMIETPEGQTVNWK